MRSLFVPAIVTATLFANTTRAELPASLELFANFNTIGVNVALAIDDPEKDCEARLEYGSIASDLHEGFPLSRVDNQHRRLSGCVFWREPGEKVFVKITLRDKTTRQLDGVSLTGTTTTKRLAVTRRFSKTLYVSPDGDGKRFTRTQPGSLEQGLATIKAGERLMLLPGHYFVGNLKLAQSGTAPKPIQIEGSARGKVIIDGAQSKPLAWRESSQKGLYVTTTQATNPNLVIAEGRRLYPHQSLTDLRDHKITIGITTKGVARFDAELDGFYRNPSTNPLVNQAWRSPRQLFVKFRDDSDPRKKTIVVAEQSRGLTLDGRSHIILKNLRFAHFGRSPAATALEIKNCQNIVIDNCIFGINDIGVLLTGESSHITIQDTEFFDAMAGYFAWKMKSTYDLVVPFSTIFPYLSRMLERGGLIYSHGFRGRGIVVRRCQFHDYAQAGHLVPGSIHPQFKDSYEVDFHDNEVFNCTEDGFELDSDARNIRIWGNTFHHCNAPLSLATAKSGPVYVIRNVFHSVTADKFAIRPEDGLKTEPGHVFKFSTGDTNARIGDLFFLHNTIDARMTAVGFHLTQPAKWKRFYARNNIVLTDQNEAIRVRSQKPLPIDIDYNAYWSLRSPTIGSVDQMAGDGKPPVELKSVRQMQTLGWERHGLQVRPEFTDQSKHLYQLTPRSKMIDRGIPIPGINDHNTHGANPDLGAFEFRD